MVAEHYIAVDGIRTRYLEQGSGPPLILVHGGTFGGAHCAEDWRLNLPGFAQHFRVLAIDKIGSGWTDNPSRDEDYAIGATVTHLRGFMQAMGIASAHLVGHSRGGYAVTRLALESPEMARTVTIVSSASLMTAPNPIYTEWAKKAAQIADERERMHYLVRANSHSGGHIGEDHIDRLLAVDRLHKIREAERKMNRIDGTRWKQFSADLVIQQTETREWVARDGFKHPLLIVWGFNDPSARFDPTGIDAIRLLMPHAPNSEVHILNEAGHYVFREQRAAFEAVVTDFCTRNVK